MQTKKQLSIDSIGILGTGKMGGAILRGLAKRLSKEQILAYDPDPNPKLSKIASYVSRAPDLEKADVVLLCTKPQILAQSLAGFRGKTRYISIAAGVSVETVCSAIPDADPKQIARAMPNLAASIGASTTAIFCKDEKLSKIAKEIFSTIGSVEVLDREELMHAFTALCGSGPAFVFSFIQGLAEGGVEAGFGYEQALRLALSTSLGSIKLLQKSGKHPVLLRDEVASPAGTTIAGLARLERHAFGSALMDAVSAASKRSWELSGESGEPPKKQGR